MTGKGRSSHTVILDAQPLRAFLIAGLDVTLIRTFEQKGATIAVSETARSRLDADDDVARAGCIVKLDQYIQAGRIIVLEESRSDRALRDRVAALTQLPAGIVTGSLAAVAHYVALAHAIGIQEGGTRATHLIDDFHGKTMMQNHGAQTIGTIDVLITAASFDIISDPSMMHDRYERLMVHNTALPLWEAARGTLTERSLFR